MSLIFSCPFIFIGLFISELFYFLAPISLYLSMPKCRNVKNGMLESDSDILALFLIESIFCLSGFFAHLWNNRFLYQHLIIDKTWLHCHFVPHRRKIAGLPDKHDDIYHKNTCKLPQFSLVDILYIFDHQQALDYCSYSLTKPSIKLQLQIKKKKFSDSQG